MSTTGDVYINSSSSCQKPKVCNFGNLKIWAERGLIHIEDTRNGRYDVISVRTALERVNAISDMLSNSRRELKEYKSMALEEFDRHLRFVEDMIDICRQAREQGMPEDPSARRDLLRRRPKIFVLNDFKM